ncbi:hypothetical protein [Clostridium sp.]|uniref:capsular polysaccharide export protein, LipB/KpsS family n=1 Tax=Clostridium sp. TaxID=1506 RepID=UPI00261B1CCA|nr:hypothetical protein [Clostridium sp.]
MFKLVKNKGLKALNNLRTKSIILFGFSTWKHDFIQKMLNRPCIFITTQDSNNDDFMKVFIKNLNFIEDIYVWSYNEPFWLNSVCTNANLNFYRVEDGFIRSKGLGLDKSIPKSLIFDNSGYLYFDSIRQSNLHMLIRNTDLSIYNLERTKGIIQTLVKYNLSKYNIINKVRNIYYQDAILVIGQNEKDISIHKSGALFTTNEALLDYVIKSNPNREIIYKPHPDTIKNPKTRLSYPENLKGILVIDDLNHLFNNISCISEVHTISSLLGFEFLLRGIKTYCYSRTWYSGWGLTEDTYMSKDLNLKKTIEEIFYCAYILYPTYYSYTYEHSSVEKIMTELLRDSE